jgi:glycosyltransferase involved in cell wall biosynthesis
VKVAYYSPFPPERSGIGDYSALLFPALQQRLDVSAVRRGARRPPRGTDVSLYHVGNNPDAHAWIVDALRRRPGVVVLHDFVLHHLVAGMTLGRGDADGYLDAMQRDAGTVGRLLAHGVVDKLLPPIWEERAKDFPLASVVLDRADALICHSHYVERLAVEYGYDGPISVIPMPAWPAIDVSGVRRLVPEGNGPVLTCVGYLNAAKRVPQLLEAFGRLRETVPDVQLVLAGSAAADVRLDSQSLGESVLRLDHLEEDELWRLLADSDVCISLRWPTMGETSGMAIRALSVGTPLVVSEVGWFSELPNAVAAKVPVDELEVETLAATLERLAADAGLRNRMSDAAARYAREEHNLDRIADLYVVALEAGAGGTAVQDAVLHDVAMAAGEVGFDMNDPELRDVADRAREVGLGN